MVRWFAILVMAGFVSQFCSVEPKAVEPNTEKPDFAAIQKAMTEAAQPSEEVQKLQPLAGNWTYTCKMWMDPSQPPIESKGTIQRTWILGNRFLEEKVTGSGPDGADFEGCGVIGYDKMQKKFTRGWVSTMGTAISTSTGSYDSSDRKFTFEKEDYCPIRKREIKMRDVVKIESDDKNVIVMYDLDGGGEKKMMELVSMRQK